MKNNTAKKLDKLPERERAVLVYKYVMDMTDNEIAALLDIQPQSVRQYLTRARRNAIMVLNKRDKNNVSNS
ncbi:MAG: sigma-70 region 4 domain-containing protein [Oscillospiraceae bacterium]|nr:sigma-70 region 4 domain-containing protein [Oscillospiraceae bacterium]